jgi:hypothetical protein
MKQLKVEQYEPHNNHGMNSGATEGKAVAAPRVAPVVSLFNDTFIIMII